LAVRQNKVFTFRVWSDGDPIDLKNIALFNLERPPPLRQRVGNDYSRFGNSVSESVLPMALLSAY